MPKIEWRQAKTKTCATRVYTATFYCGVGFLGGDATLAGVALVDGEALADGEDLAEADGFGDGDCTADAPEFRAGTVAEATSCHCPLRRAKVSTDRNSPLTS